MNCPVCKVSFLNNGEMLNHFRHVRCSTEEQRFWARVEKSDGCWLWTGAQHFRGYGATTPIRGHTRAHRVSWVLTNGLIPDGAGVLHRCDTPLCVNPAHLYLGSQRQNLADCVARGRYGNKDKPIEDLLHPHLSKRIAKGGD